MASIFGDYTSRNEKRISTYVSKVNSLENEYKNITHDQSIVVIKQYNSFYRVTREQAAFMARTFLFRKKLREGSSIEDILPEALALVREATRRKLGMFHFDVQLEASIAMLGNVLNKNKDGEEVRENIIAEMKTGEGKSLVQLLIGYLNALEATKDEDPSKWKSVHIMTSNDALAKRDASDNGKVFSLLGLSCGFVPGRRSVEGKSAAERNIYKRKKQQAYMCDIVYSTATNIAFDYLDDNTVINKSDINIRKPFGFAIIDEADDLLIDQAINPLEISGTPRGLTSEYIDYINYKEKIKLDSYKWAAEFLYGKKGVRDSALSCKIYDQFNSHRNETFKEKIAYVKDTQEVIFSDSVLKEIYDAALKRTSNYSEVEAIYQMNINALMDCVKAEYTYSREKYYELIKSQNGKYKIVLVDQNTGRLKYGSKYIDGMQEAIEAIETYKGSIHGYEIEKSKRTETLARCTYPDFLSLYENGVCGMTGTSAREEFAELYGFQTYDVRTRKPVRRTDLEDRVYATKRQKNAAIIKEIIRAHKTGQPVLIGTSSVEESKEISRLLSEAGIKHQLLNATNEERENAIIAASGHRGSVTIATNMAGRGVDIKLDNDLRDTCGLYVIGTTRNKSERIDRQLRGRAGRQGDKGKSIYFSSLEDDLVKLYINTNALVKLFNKGDGLITNSKVIRAVNKALHRKDEKDKENRRVYEELNRVFSSHKNQIYQMRRNVLNFDPKTFLDNIKIIMLEYSEFLVHNYEIEDIKKLVGHIADVDACSSSNRVAFINNLATSMYEKLKSNFDKKTMTKEDLGKYLNNLRIKFLNVIDVYYQEHMKTLETIKSNVANNRSVDTIKEFEMQANISFGRVLIPHIYNEMITYACNPSMKFGTYDPNVVESDQMIVR